MATHPDGEPTTQHGEIQDGFGDRLHAATSDYVALVRREAEAAGIALPPTDEEVIRFAARAAFEAQ